MATECKELVAGTTVGQITFFGEAEDWMDETPGAQSEIGSHMADKSGGPKPSHSLFDSDGEKGDARQDVGEPNALGELGAGAPVQSRGESGASDTKRSIMHRKSSSADSTGTSGECRYREACTNGVGDANLAEQSVGAMRTRVSTNIRANLYWYCGGMKGFLCLCSLGHITLSHSCC